MSRPALLVALLGLFLVLPPAAGASCIEMRPKERLAQAESAFVGRLAERTGDRMTFVVEERIKGALPDRVEVDDDVPNSTIGLRPAVGERIALLLTRRGGDGRYRANECERLSPEALREAAAAGPGPCSAPEIRLGATSAPGRRIVLRLRLADPDGVLSSFTVRWGDGRSSTRSIATGTEAIVRLGHRYRRPGRRTIKVTTSSRPGPACGISRQVSDEERLTVRPRR